MCPAAALTGESVDLAQAQAGALADLLGGEEGFKHPRDDLGRHAHAIVRDGDADIVAGGEIEHLAGLEGAREGLHRDAALVREGVAGVDDQVQESGLELGRIHTDAGPAPPQLELELHGFSDSAAQQGLAFPDLDIEIDRLGPQRLTPREGQQLVGEAFAAARRRQCGLAQLLTLGCVVGRAKDDVEGPDHHRQQIIEVMGHAAGQPPDRLHSLGMHQVGLGLGLFREGLTDALFQQFVDPLQVLFGALGLSDVEVGPDIALIFSCRVKARQAFAAQPALAQRRVDDTDQAFETITTLDRCGEGQTEWPGVIRMDQPPPALRHFGVGLDAEEDAVPAVGEAGVSLGVEHPDQGRGAVGDGAKPRLRLHQTVFGLDPGGLVPQGQHGADGTVVGPQYRPRIADSQNLGSVGPMNAPPSVGHRLAPDYGPGQRKLFGRIGGAVLGEQSVRFRIGVRRDVQARDAVMAHCRIVDEDDLAARVGHDDPFRQLAEDGVAFGGGGFQLEGGFADVGNVKGHADKTDDIAGRAEPGPGEGFKPPIFSVVAQVSRLEGEGLAGRFPGRGFGENTFVIIRMHHGAPVGEPGLLIGPAIESDIGLVDEGAGAVLPGHPDGYGRGVGDRPEPLFALTHLARGAGALDLAPGPDRDFLKQFDFGLGPVPDGFVVRIQERPQASAADHRRPHQRADLQSVEDLQRVLGPGIILHVGYTDHAALGEVGDQVGPQVLKTELALRAGDSVGRVASHGHQTAGLVDLPVADPVRAELGAQRPLHLAHDLLGRGQVPQPVRQTQQEGLAALLSLEGVDRLARLGDVERQADIAQELTVGVQTRVYRDPHPAPHAVGAPETRLEAVGQVVGPGRRHGGLDAGPVVGMQGQFPDVAQDSLRGLAVEVNEGRIDELHLGLGVGHPDRRGGGVGHQAKARLALAQGDLGRPRLGDIEFGADHAAVPARRDGGDDHRRQQDHEAGGTTVDRDKRSVDQQARGGAADPDQGRRPPWSRAEPRQPGPDPADAHEPDPVPKRNIVPSSRVRDSANVLAPGAFLQGRRFRSGLAPGPGTPNCHPTSVHPSQKPACPKPLTAAFGASGGRRSLPLGGRGRLTDQCFSA